MAQAGYTPIQLYYSNTATNAPASLANGEVAINQADGKLYYRNNSGSVTLFTVANTGVTTVSFGSTGLTPSTATSGAVTVAGTLAVANGGTGVTASTGATSVMLRDANQNTKINNISFGTASTATSATPISLTVASAHVQNFTGTSNQVLNLPDATTLDVGSIYYINNESNGTVSIKNNGGTTLYVVYTGGATQLTLLTNSTANGTWQQSAFIPNNVTWSLTTLTATSTTANFNTLQLSNALTTSYGGTGLTTYTAGDLIYYASGTSFTKLGIGTAGQVLTVNGGGTAPQWSTASASGVASITFGTTGLTPSTASTGAVTVAGTLAAANGGTGQSSAFTQYGVTYANATTTLATTAAGTSSQVLHGNASGAPTWGAVALATEVSGTLGAANGGTGVANNSASTITISGNFASTFVVAGANSYTLPNASDTLVNLGSTQTLTAKTLTNPTVTNYVESVVAIGNSGTSQTLALTNGTVQTVTMTGNCTFTMPTNVAGKSFILIINTGAGSFTGTFTSVKWPSGTAPTLTTTASRWDIASFVADGTNWYGNIAQAYS